MSEDARSDRLRIDYAASVSNATKLRINEAILTVVTEDGLYAYERYDKVMGAWSVDVTAYDRTAKHPITDEQVLGYLKSIAEERGVSISQILREAEKM